MSPQPSTTDRRPTPSQVYAELRATSLNGHAPGCMCNECALVVHHNLTRVMFPAGFADASFAYAAADTGPLTTPPACWYCGAGRNAAEAAAGRPELWRVAVQLKRRRPDGTESRVGYALVYHCGQHRPTQMPAFAPVGLVAVSHAPPSPEWLASPFAAVVDGGSS